MNSSIAIMILTAYSWGKVEHVTVSVDYSLGKVKRPERWTPVREGLTDVHLQWRKVLGNSPVPTGGNGRMGKGLA